MRTKRSLVWVVFAWTLAVLLTVPASAQESQPPPSPAGGTQDLSVWTPFPSQEVAIGDEITIALKLRATGAPQIVQLEAAKLPADWTAIFRGDNKAVKSAFVRSDADTEVSLRLEPPDSVQAGSYDFEVVARGERSTARLPIELTLADKAPGGGLSLNVDLPTLRGAPDSKLTYSAKIKNDSDSDLTVNLQADAPKEAQVDFKLAGQSVNSFPVGPGETKTLSVETQIFPDAPAGEYPIKVMAEGGDQQATAELLAEVTGKTDLQLSAPDGRLSGEATAGEITPFTLVLKNNGSAPAKQVELSATPPTGWEVTFEPQRVAEVAPGQTVEVKANVKPADQAIAGDYVINYTARPEEGASKAVDFRVTVTTSTLWGIVGVALIAVAVGVVGLAVARFGRR